MHYEQVLSREIALYPCGKFQADVESFFHDLKVTAHVRGCASTDEQDGCLSLADYLENRSDKSLLVVCDYEVNAHREELESFGLRYGVDFIFGVDLVGMVDESETFRTLRNYSGKTVIVFGTGKAAEIMMKNNPHLDVDYFIDNDAQKVGGIFFDRAIKAVRELEKERHDSFIVIVAVKPNIAIKRQLMDMGLEFGADFYFYNYLFFHASPNAYSTLLNKAIQSPARYEVSCSLNSRPTAITRGGRVLVCCGDVSFPIGNVLYSSVEKILSDTDFALAWLSIENKSHCFCNDKCSYLRKCRHNEKAPVARGRRIEHPPGLGDLEIQVNYDRSCNLKCKSCRTTFIHQPEDPPEILAMIHEEAKRVAQKGPRNFRVGNGEIFFSELYKDIFFNDLKRKDIFLLSNGMLFNQDNWEKLKARYDTISMAFSVDAATEPTYRLLRGGDFRILRKNLEFAGELRRSGELKELDLWFVIQKDNFREMPDFAQLGLQIHADSISFTVLHNWGAYTADEFACLNVLDPRHPCHEEFVQIIQDPVLSQPQVTIMNRELYLSGLRPATGY